MKKKFFTLLAAAAFCGVGVVNAQISMGQKHTSALKQGALYHIGDANTLGDYMYAKGDSLMMGNPLTAADVPTLAKAMWCVKAAKPVSSTYPDFTFENKGAEKFLSVDLTPYLDNSTVKQYPARLTYSDVNTWRFSSTYQAGMDATENYLMSYLPQTKDSVAVLSYDQLTSEVYVNIIKAPSASDTPASVQAQIDNNATGTTLIQAFLYDAAPIVLTANDFNTLLGSAKSAARKFNYLDPKIDQLEDSSLKESFIAKDAVGVTDAGNNGGYLTLRLGSDTTKVLRVDTTVYNTAGNPYLKHAFSKYSEYTTAGNPIYDQHHFRLVYLPSVDSLIVNVHSVRKPIKGDDLKKPLTWGLEFSNDDPNDIAQYHNTVAGTGYDDKTYLVVQNLTQTTYCLTVGEFPVQVHIGLGFTGCEIVDDQRTTMQGLFIIKNEAGKYLQVPIYTDTTNIGTNDYSAPQWVTLEKNVDPREMPSFQWVVEKVRANDDKNISEILVTSREYGTQVNTNRVQLYKNKASKLFGADVKANKIEEFDFNSKENGFIEVGKAYRTDSTLGYKSISDELAKVMTYSFNYLHEYKDTEYLSVKNSESDSLIHVSADSDGFSLIPYHHSYNNGKWSKVPVHYGYTGNLNTTIGKGYIVDLYRTAYVMKVKEGNKLYNTNKIVVVDKEKRYAVTSGDSTKNYITAGDSAVFYFKANNTKGGINYYALVDTSTYTVGNNPMFTVKGGVDDNNLWLKAQNHKEIRTSAFAIEPNEDPLYRRFNRLTDGAIGSDDFYSGDDGTDNPDTLRFFRMNNERELLYEDAYSKYSKGKGINFLGYKHEADFGLEDAALKERTAMYVDTAFVNRPATNDADFDTPKPQYLLGLGVKILNDSIYRDDCGCEPDVLFPGYKRGRYLINATDSVYGATRKDINTWTSNWKPGYTPAKNAINGTKNNYIWDTSWERLAFVDAVHKGDTLYVLGKAGKDYADPINFETLKKDVRIHAIYLGNNYHKDVVFSFRLIDSEKEKAYAEQDQYFLIESETTDRDIKKGEMIAPMTGGWVKLQNGVPVISRGQYWDAINDAEKFNVVKTDANPVSNEDVKVEAVATVVAGNGNVTITNAAGKTVAISNILGQTIANKVITSNNETITAPKGIVVVAIEGEDAVKAIVK